MNYYRVVKPEGNRIWGKYFTYSYDFFNNDHIAIDFFSDATQHQRPALEGLKIQALNQQGDVIRHQSYFTKDKIPPYSNIRGLFLIREDVMQHELFTGLVGVKFLTVKVDGEFEWNYSLLSFFDVLESVDWERSVRTPFDFTSKLVLAKSKIPDNIDGFFLSGWHNYGQYYSIVNERLRNALLALKEASKFLIFDKVDVSD